MYKFGANYPGLGSQMASTTYIVSPDAQGQSIGQALPCPGTGGGLRCHACQLRGQHQCADRGSVQGAGIHHRRHFPKAFRHKHLGLADAYVMHSFLFRQHN